MEGPPLGPGGEDITWPDQVAPRGRKASSTRKIKPQTSNLDSTLVQALQRESDGLALGDFKDRLRPQDAIETMPGGDEYVVTNTNAPNSPCHVPVPDGVSECGLSKLPSSIHSDDETDHDAFIVQTCVEEVENAEYIATLKPLLSMRVDDPLDEELDPRSRLPHMGTQQALHELKIYLPLPGGDLLFEVLLQLGWISHTSLLQWP